MKLTNASVAKLELPKGRSQTVWCSADPSFGVRVNPGGRKSYVAKVGQRKQTLGSTHVLNIAQAREAAKKLQAKQALGQLGEAAPVTFATAIDDYVDRHISNKSARYIAAWRTLKKRIPTDVRSKKLGAVSRQDLLRVLSQFGDRPGVEDMAVKQLNAAFNFWLNEETVTRNPLAGFKRKQRCQPRTSVYTDEELRRLWNAKGDPQMVRALKLLILTGCRAREVLELEEQEVTPTGSTVPAHRTKTNKALNVTLPRPALRLLRQWQFAPMDIHCFRRAMRSAAQVDGTIHDLRRTMASKLLALGVQPHVVSLCLNHVPHGFGGVERSYLQYDYAAERAAALVLWWKWLESL